MFLLPDLTLRLRPTLFALRPGTRIVSNTWDMRGTDDDPEAPGWDPDQTIVLDPCPGFCTPHLWTVPAKVGGIWRTDDVGSQSLGAAVSNGDRLAGRWWPDGSNRGGGLSGSIFTFRAAGTDYRAEVDDSTMRGVARRDNDTRTWQSQRVQ